MKPDPLGGPRDPFRVFLLPWCVVNGLALVVPGVPETSATLDRELSALTERLYGGLLAVSAGLVLAGMFWPWDPRDGLTAKLGGYVGMSAATAIFAVVTLSAWTLGGVFVCGASLAFSGICLIMARNVWHRMRDGMRPRGDE